MTTIWNNDYARAFFKDHGYPEQYNDGLLAYLRDTYPFAGGQTLPDLLARYLNEYGDTFNMIIAGKSAVAQTVIAPAATFTSTTPTDGGSGTIVLTSAGAHGLTSAVAVGQQIYISAGTGWTSGFYPITAIDSDTTGVAVTITGTFDVGMGSPTIALVDTEVPLASIAIPALLDNSVIRVDTTSTSSDTSSATKRLRVKLESTAFTNIALSTAPNNRRITIIHNRGATNSQVAGISATTGGGEGSVAGNPPTGTVDTSVATTLYITMELNTANVPAGINRYLIEVFK